MPTAMRFAVAAIAVFLPLGANAQGALSVDLAYCAKMSVLYARYVATDEFSPIFRKPEVEGRVALAKCQAGDAATAIPILERKLTDAKVELPARR